MGEDGSAGAPDPHFIWGYLGAILVLCWSIFRSCCCHRFWIEFLQILQDLAVGPSQLHPCGGAGLRKVLVLAQALEFIEALPP